ncbi:MAG TPA: MFS transporter [Caulobacteraceae bacterium]|jgi:PAT family beta-lactamase induction signal transducer AmpG|nr:MFS transporter [Caulobacteraceae bacterium]
MATPIPAVPKKRHKAKDVLRSLTRPKVAVMLALGFAAGLPFMLIGNTLAYWMREGGVDLKVIGFASWVGLAYTLKFLWAPVIDRVGVPFLGRLGRRRGWMILAQFVIGCGLLLMAMIGPGAGMSFFYVAAVVAFAAATQDIVVDAWRIEIADDPDELGLLTSTYSLGYRAALLCTEALILILADRVGWPVSYGMFGLMMAIGVGATLFAREPTRADEILEAKEAEAPLWTPRGFADAVAGPFIAFFKEHGRFALLMLVMITLYHLSDYMRGPISNPFYHDLGIEKTTVGLVRGSIGLWCTIAGVATGGLASVRLGYFRTLIIGAIIQPLFIAPFGVLALVGPHTPLFGAIMGFDAFAIGFSGVALVAYMSSLTSLGYTASQYAVLTSAVAFTGKTLKGFSGAIVEQLQQGRDLLHAYSLFYFGAALFGVPAVILCLILARPRADGPTAEPEPAPAG